MFSYWVWKNQKHWFRRERVFWKLPMSKICILFVLYRLFVALVIRISHVRWWLRSVTAVRCVYGTPRRRKWSRNSPIIKHLEQLFPSPHSMTCCCAQRDSINVSYFMMCLDESKSKLTDHKTRINLSQISWVFSKKIKSLVDIAFIALKRKLFEQTSLGSLKNVKKK